MKPTNIPEWIKDHVFGLAILTHDGKDYQYAIIDPNFGIKNGIAANFTIAVEEALAVSNACPFEYRELYLIHEIIESDDTCRDHEVCLRALMEELRLAEERGFGMRKYVEDRLQFFMDTAAYYKKLAQENKELVKACMKIERSLLYLRRLNTKMESAN
jgi:hypothetical protein